MPETRILEVSVIAAGELLLDGIPITVKKLEEVIRENAAAKLFVWYYRENAASDAPPVATEVLKLITEHGLPIRLSSRPDFSDAVTGIEESLEKAFAAVREKASHGQLVIVRPDGRMVTLPRLEKSPPRGDRSDRKDPAFECQTQRSGNGRNGLDDGADAQLAGTARDLIH